MFRHRLGRATKIHRPDNGGLGMGVLFIVGLTGKTGFGLECRHYEKCTGGTLKTKVGQLSHKHCLTFDKVPCLSGTLFLHLCEVRVVRSLPCLVAFDKVRTHVEGSKGV